MTNQTTFTTVADGDTLSQGYYNGILNAGIVKKSTWSDSVVHEEASVPFLEMKRASLVLTNPTGHLLGLSGSYETVNIATGTVTSRLVAWNSVGSYEITTATQVGSGANFTTVNDTLFDTPTRLALTHTGSFVFNIYGKTTGTNSAIHRIGVDFYYLDYIPLSGNTITNIIT